jgi:hypothetical protein
LSRLFPELDGAARPSAAVTPKLRAGRAPARNAMPVEVARGPAQAPQPPPPQAQPSEHRPQSAGAKDPTAPCILGGVQSMQRFDTLFGLPGALTSDGGCHVVSVRALQEGHLELEVLGGGVPRTTITVTPRDQGERVASTEHFTLGYLGRQASEPLQRMLVRAAQRMARVTMMQLLKVILSDPARRVEHVRAAGTSGEGGDTHAGADPADMLRSLVQVYGSGEAWCNFFADKEQQRNFCHNVSGSIVMIGHEDLECHYATPPTNDGSMSFFNYPKIHDRYTPGLDGEGAGGAVSSSVERRDSRDPGYLISDLHDLDIIKGGAKKLDRALDTILEYDKKPEMVVVRATCVPIVIGDDMEGSVERFKKKSGLPVIYLDNIADQHATPFRDVFRNVKNEPDFKAPRKIPRSINLLGFPRETEIGPLVAVLRQLGITVNCRILPEVDVNVMRGYTRAELAVLFDSALHDQSYREIVGDIEMPSIRPTAPYGVRHTRQWLWEIASTLGIPEGPFEQAWADYVRPFEPRWDALKKRAAGYRLGFVVDRERLQLLAEPSRWMGIPVLDLVREMGFGVDLLARAGAVSDESARALVGDLAAEGDRVLGFATPEDLGRKLRESDAQAFYSDVFFDRRLTRSGKGQFSTKVFQLGLAGALSAIEQLTSACRMPFYRKYSSYLGEAFHG